MRLLSVKKLNQMFLSCQKVSVEQDELFSLVSKAQRGRIDEQRCSLGPTTRQQAHAYSSPGQILRLRYEFTVEDSFTFTLIF